MKWFRVQPQPDFPRARSRTDLVVISAVSDGEWSGVEDLLDSLRTYIDCRYEVVFADDASSDGTHERLLDSGCWVVRNPSKLRLAGLNLSLRRAMLEGYRLFDAPLFLKIDPDALIIGPGIMSAVREHFDASPATGLLGTYKIDWNGAPRDLSYWRDQMLRRSADFQEVLDLAMHAGYEPGDGVQGGAYFFTRTCLSRMIAAGWLEGRGGYQPSIEHAYRISEDTLFTMLVYASGHIAKDIGGPGQPFGLWDKGLPMAPEELVRQGRLVTHAIKYADETSLAARHYFRLLRQQHALRAGA